MKAINNFINESRKKNVLTLISIAIKDYRFKPDTNKKIKNTIKKWINEFNINDYNLYVFWACGYDLKYKGYEEDQDYIVIGNKDKKYEDILKSNKNKKIEIVSYDTYNFEKQDYSDKQTYYITYDENNLYFVCNYEWKEKYECIIHIENK